MILPASSMPVIANPFLLDVISGAARAYSVARKLRSSYTGNCLDVRKSSGGVYILPAQTIGFNSENKVDASAILSYLGTMSAGQVGHAVVVYDQTNNANASNSSSTPGIVPVIATSFGANPLVQPFNGNLGMASNSSPDEFLTFSPVTLSGDYTIYAVCYAQNSGTGGVISGSESANGYNNTFLIHSTSNTIIGDRTGSSNNNTATPANAIKTIVATRSGTTRSLYVNGVLQTVTTASATQNQTLSEIFRRIQNVGVYAYFLGAIAEIGVFTRALSVSEIDYLSNNCMQTFGAS